MDTSETDARLELLEQMREQLTSTADLENGLFHFYDEFLNAPLLDFAIDGFLQEGCATCIAALPGNGKT